MDESLRQNHVPKFALLGDLNWKNQGLWAIDSSNPNSWTTAETAILPKSAADILLMQKTMQSSPLLPQPLASSVDPGSSGGLEHLPG